VPEQSGVCGPYPVSAVPEPVEGRRHTIRSLRGSGSRPYPVSEALEDTPFDPFEALRERQRPFFPVKTHRFFFKNKKVISFLMNGFYA